MRQWLKNQLFPPGGALPRFRVFREGNEITWTPLPPLPITEFSHEEVAHSEEEMLKPDRVAGDRIFRADLRQAFIFTGKNPLDPERYFRVMDIGAGYVHQSFAPPGELVSTENHDIPTPSTPFCPAQDECKFHSGTLLLRCAVNPCAKTCEECLDFEPKFEGSQSC